MTQIQAWHITGQYPDSTENRYEDYVLMPIDWDETRARQALVTQAEADDDTALGELLHETAVLERVPHTMVDGQLYVPAQTTKAVYR